MGKMGEIIGVKWIWAIIDVMMPILDGFKLIKKNKRRA